MKLLFAAIVAPSIRPVCAVAEGSRLQMAPLDRRYFMAVVIEMYCPQPKQMLSGTSYNRYYLSD
jgi:hypothetical protein